MKVVIKITEGRKRVKKREHGPEKEKNYRYDQYYFIYRYLSIITLI
jgi:hypothetical protein